MVAFLSSFSKPGRTARLYFVIYFFYPHFSYASRVKLITNDASKNAENKEIVRLKGVSNYFLDLSLILPLFLLSH